MAKIDLTYKAGWMDNFFRALQQSVSDAGPLALKTASQWEDHRHRLWRLEFEFCAKMDLQSKTVKRVAISIPTRDYRTYDQAAMERVRQKVHNKVLEDLEQYLDTGSGDVVVWDEQEDDDGGLSVKWPGGYTPWKRRLLENR
jgi:hypothetical protein